MSIVGHDIDIMTDNGEAYSRHNIDGRTDDERTKSRSDAKGSASNVGKTDRRCEKTDGGAASTAPKNTNSAVEPSGSKIKVKGTNGGSTTATVKCTSLVTRLRTELAVLEFERRAKKMAVGR